MLIGTPPVLDFYISKEQSKMQNSSNQSQELPAQPSESGGADADLVASLSGRELDVAVAECVMGLVPCKATHRDEGIFCHALPDSPDKGGETPCFSTDIAAAMQVEDRIAELDLRAEYGEALLKIVQDAVQYRLVDLFDLAHATTEQRCRAALQATTTKVDEGKSAQ